MGNEQTKEVLQDISSPHNANLKPMQGKFQKGVQYNMKIIIRGDIRTGKSSLFNRLQGDPFKEDYITTPQIQVANIQWKYNETNDIIKVEIWDVVDKGINPTSMNRRPNLSDGTGLKIDNNQGPVTPTSPVQLETESSPDQLTLDAATIDVYRNTHGVILMFDITKSWTFDYAIKELKLIPEHMAVLLLGNFCDLSSQRVVTESQIYQSIAECNRLRVTGYPPANMIRYVETSMPTGFGLKYIHKYLGIPFLQLQRDILRQQLELKSKELALLLDTLDSNSEQISSSARKRGNISNNIQELKQAEQDRLEQGKSSLKDLWDKEFQDLSQPQKESESESGENVSSALNLDEHTPVTLISKRPKATTPDIAIIDEFDAGELEDDFFDDAPDPSLVLPPAPPLKVEEQDDLDSSNPMVTADEDLVGNVVNDMEDDGDHNIRQPIKFNSDLNDVWKLRHIRQNSTASASRISNDSSDDDLITGAKQMNLLDNRPSNAEKSRLSQALREENNYETSKYPENVLSMISNPYSLPNDVGVSNSLSQGNNDFIDSSFDMGDYTPMTFGTPSAYEEIGEGQDNPWLEGDSNQRSATTQSRELNSSRSTQDEVHHQKLHLHHPKRFDEELIISSSPWGGSNNYESKSESDYIQQNTRNTEVSLLDAYIKTKEQSTIETIPKKKMKMKKNDSDNTKEEENNETKKEKSKKKKPKSDEKSSKKKSVKINI